MNYNEANWEIDSILHYLVHTGYLTYQTKSDGEYGEVWIPNKEVRSHWEKHVIKLLKSVLCPKYQTKLSSSIMAAPFDIKALETTMREMLLNCSFHDLTCENSHHVFFYGCILTIMHDGETIIVSTNKEAGHGRYDIFIHLVNLRRVLVIECKKSASKRVLQSDAKKAVKQIEDRNYLAGISGRECIIVGAAFYGKHMSTLESKRGNRD